MNITIDLKDKKIAVAMGLIAVLLVVSIAVIFISQSTSTSSSTASSFESSLAQGVLYFKEGQYQQAAAQFASAVAKDTNGPAKSKGICHYDLGTADAQLGFLSAAVTQFQMATQYYPTYPYGYLNLAIAEHKSAPAASSRDFKKALELGIAEYRAGQQSAGAHVIRSVISQDKALSSLVPRSVRY